MMDNIPKKLGKGKNGWKSFVSKIENLLSANLVDNFEFKVQEEAWYIIYYILNYLF